MIQCTIIHYVVVPQRGSIAQRTSSVRPSVLLSRRGFWLENRNPWKVLI